MRRISKRLIRKIAQAILIRKKTATQIEIQQEIERYIGRPLSKYEKVRITLVLEEHYTVKRRKIDPKTKRRVIYFIF